MTDFSDSPAVKRANELLDQGDNAASADLLEAQRGISDNLRELNARPRIEPARATSVAEHDRLAKELEQQKIVSRILGTLYSRLTAAIDRSQALEAINGADESRKTLDAALDALEAAQREAVAARDAVLAHTKKMQAQKSAASRMNDGTVGATPAQIDRIVAAGAFDARMGETTGINSLRSKVQAKGTVKPANEARYIDKGAGDASPVNVT